MNQSTPPDDETLLPDIVGGVRRERAMEQLAKLGAEPKTEADFSKLLESLNRLMVARMLATGWDRWDLEIAGFGPNEEVADRISWKAVQK